MRPGWASFFPSAFSPTRRFANRPACDRLRSPVRTSPSTRPCAADLPAQRVARFPAGTAKHRRYLFKNASRPRPNSCAFALNAILRVPDRIRQTPVLGPRGLPPGQGTMRSQLVFRKGLSPVRPPHRAARLSYPPRGGPSFLPSTGERIVGRNKEPVLKPSSTNLSPVPSTGRFSIGNQNSKKKRRGNLIGTALRRPVSAGPPFCPNAFEHHLCFFCFFFATSRTASAQPNEVRHVRSPHRMPWSEPLPCR